MTSLGFLGTGAITAAIVRGLKASPLRDWPIILSPRNAELSRELSASLPGVKAALGNQQVVDEAEVIILAVLPRDAEAVVKSLRFRPGQRIISLVAALDIERVRDWTGISAVTRAIPLPFVAQRSGVTPVMPPDEMAAAIFGALGACIEVSDPEVFDGYGAASALMATYFGIIEQAQKWLIANGLPAGDSERYLRSLFGSLGDVLRDRPQPLAELRTAHSTRGGLNELAHDTFMRAGGGPALAEGLTAVLARIHAQKTPPA